MHKVAYYYFDVLLGFDCINLPDSFCFWVEQAFFFFLPAYVGSRVFVPKDSRIAQLCVLDVFLDLLLYIIYSVSALKWP